MECLLKTNAGHRQKASEGDRMNYQKRPPKQIQNVIPNHCKSNKKLGLYKADCVVRNANSSFMFGGSRLCAWFCAGSWRLFAVSFAIVVCGVMCGVWCVCVVCVWCVCVCGCVCVCVCLCWGGPTKQRCKIDADAWPKSSKKVLEGSKIMKMYRKFMQKLYKMVLGGLGCPVDVPVDKKVPEKRDQVHQGI